MDIKTFEEIKQETIEKIIDKHFKGETNGNEKLALKTYFEEVFYQIIIFALTYEV